MAWEYAIKGTMCFGHYGKWKSYVRNRSYPHIHPLNTKKDFRFKAQQTANTKALLPYKAKNDHVPIHSYGAGLQSKDRIHTNTALAR